ncbi:TolB family protein [Streptomyces sp. DT171]|uniref:TolB family protein n=1 Tax=Streptomyces sp. DT171 TaxID=3416524 RepID=UPI003CEBA020
MTWRPATGGGRGRGGARRRAVLGGCALTAVVLAGATLPAAAAPAAPRTVRVSVAPGGAQPNGASYSEGLSTDGRYALFSSDADNLVSGDTNGTWDLFVRDLWTGTTKRVSVGADGGQSASGASEGAISGDGRYVTFASDDDSLTPGDTNETQDIYVHDRVTGRTERITPGTVPPDSKGGLAANPTISWNGRYVAYETTRSDLVPGEGRPKESIVVTDRGTGVTHVASIGADGSRADQASRQPGISADGQSVTFISKATNLLTADEPDPDDPEEDAGASPDTGPGTGPAGARADAEIMKPRLYPLYVYDLRTGHVRGASVAPDGRLLGVVSGTIAPDGRHVVFNGWEIDERSIITHRYIVCVHDLRTGTTAVVGKGIGGAEGNGDDSGGVMSADRRWVYFTSTSDNLVPGDTNGRADLFRHNLLTGRTELAYVPESPQTTEPYEPSVDALGTTLLFTAEDGALPSGDTNGYPDVFVRRTPLL